MKIKAWIVVTEFCIIHHCITRHSTFTVVKENCSSTKVSVCSETFMLMEKKIKCVILTAQVVGAPQLCRAA